MPKLLKKYLVISRFVLTIPLSGYGQMVHLSIQGGWAYAYELTLPRLQRFDDRSNFTPLIGNIPSVAGRKQEVVKLLPCNSGFSENTHTFDDSKCKQQSLSTVTKECVRDQVFH